MFKKLLSLALLLALVFGLGFGIRPAAAAVTELTIIWAQWAPADYLQTLVKDYEAVAGVKVNVVQEPWGTFLNRVAAEWAAKGSAFDMVVGDSQWLGQGASQGHYVELTDFMKNNGDLAKTVTPATLQYYGEYPAGSGRYWAFPTEGDANGWAYRKDLFEDPKEKEAFKAKYGRELGIPTTWTELIDIAKFFTRKDQGLYGAAIYTQKDYDAITMGFQNIFFSYGGDWYNSEFKTEGVVNSENAIKALEMYRELYECCSPPGLSNAFFQETNDAYTSGQVAMTMNYFAFFPALANTASNKFADVTGYFSMPSGIDGKRYAALGGQGISINAYISDERKQASFDFLKWFATKDVQQKWAELGGYTCNIEVLNSEAFLKVAPFNAAFAETMTFVKDFTNIPEYGAMLPIVQENLHNYVVGGQGTAKEALDRIAVGLQEILTDAGYPK
jgi:multiple sugar transport system substrate-binding protein